MTQHQTKDWNLLNLLWKKVSYFLALRVVIAIFFALLGSFGGYLGATYNENASRLESRLAGFESTRNAWIDASASVFTNSNSLAVDKPHLPNKDDIQRIRIATNNLINELNSVPTPTSNIENAAYNFNLSLSDIIRELGKYNASPEATTKIIEASQMAAVEGEAHRAAIQKFLGSTYLRLKGSI